MYPIPVQGTVLASSGTGVGKIVPAVLPVANPTNEDLSVVELAYLFQIETQGRDSRIARRFSRSLSLPDDDESPDRPAFHTSLGDFLTTQARSNEFFINAPVCVTSLDPLIA